MRESADSNPSRLRRSVGTWNKISDVQTRPESVLLAASTDYEPMGQSSGMRASYCISIPAINQPLPSGIRCEAAPRARSVFWFSPAMLRTISLSVVQ
jgi:hypothetical protein